MMRRALLPLLAMSIAIAPPARGQDPAPAATQRPAPPATQEPAPECDPVNLPEVEEGWRRAGTIWLHRP